MRGTISTGSQRVHLQDVPTRRRHHPHKLGKEEAARRLKSRLRQVRSTFGEKFVVLKDEWTGDHLDFRASLLGQTTTGTVDVADDHVRLEVELPWMLSLLANKAKAMVQKQGQLMLEKPSKPTSGLS